MKTVKKPDAMKVSTATSERGESRARPQTPCPEVQPEPSPVPSPTNSPASPMPGRLSETVWTMVPPSSLKICGAAISPRMKVSRQPRSRGAPPIGTTAPMTPLVMPAMPAILPKSPMTMTALSPINAPPTSEGQGVKSVAMIGPMPKLL
jgi:hypothetical protein